MFETPTLDRPNKRTKPDWLKVKIPGGTEYSKVKQIVKDNSLHTICQDGNCPNMAECWGVGTATLMILGNICTRSCSFCAVLTGRPNEYDLNEPDRVAEAVRKMQLKHCVITSVNRDELSDKGSLVWALTIRRIKELNPETTIETLIPDFKADWEALYRVTDEKPEVISHNMETVKRLYRMVRPQAKYERSLEQIKRTREKGIRTKSGIMVGLGETEDEVFEIMSDLLKNGCNVLTIGQYLQPTKMHLTVKEFVSPEQFGKYKTIGEDMGFDIVESGPMVRSSYHAEKHI
ncbi:MAG: lipoyl synthase [Flavobacteriales bacterium]|nr:lipoyl synthase [Flavobacteriales bacterium]